MKHQYQEALNNNGYKHELKFEKVNLDENNKNKSKKNRKRKREITWYNPPWNEGVKTNIGKKFLKIIENFKSKNNALSKIVNKNTCKVSYRTMPNLSKIISSHNQKILRSKNKTIERECSCRSNDKNSCLLGGKCLLKNIVYQAKITPHPNFKNF